ncbi:MAG TPA: hypothetical protein VHM90_22825 [Phycisphaerae bacterium]|nr:hypothetical protein [Phycisphaerae bacterium]
MKNRQYNAAMKDVVLENYGVRIRRSGHAVKYSLPWRRHPGMKGSAGLGFLVAVLPCVAAMLMPVFVLPRVLNGATPTQTALAWVISGIWSAVSGSFACLFGAMVASRATRWGRAWIWVNSRRILAVQLMGEDSRFGRMRLEDMVEFSVLCDHGDRQNPAASGRLLVCTGDDATRLLADYPVELLQAMKAELEGVCGGGGGAEDGRKK